MEAIESQKKGIKDYATFDVNQFKPIGIETKAVKKKGGTWTGYNVDKEEYFGGQSPDVVFDAVIDTAHFVKLFRESILDIPKLSIPAYRLVHYIMFNLGKDQDFVTINVNDFLDMFGYNKPEKVQGLPTPQRNTVHYYRAVAELLKKEYICKKSGRPQSFFINMNKIFNGDRTKLI